MHAPTSAESPVRDYDRAVHRVALLLLAVGLFGRAVRYAVNAPLWGDEAMLALNVAGRDFLGLTAMLDFVQVSPVLFLWAERAALLLFGDGEWALRAVPFLAGVAALGLFWDFARRVVPPTAAVLAVGLLAAGRWPITLAATVKPYSCDLFWAAALLTLAARWHQRPGRLWPLVLLAAVGPAAVAGSYPSVFVAGAVSVYLLPVVWRHPDWRVRIAFVAYNLLLAGTFAGCFLFVGRAQLDPAGQTVGRFMFDYWRHGFPPDDPLGVPGWLLRVHTGRMFAYPIGDTHGGSTLTFLLFAAGVWGCWKGGNRPLVVLCLVPFALNLLAAVLHKYPYGGCCRLSQHLAPAVCLMAGVGWARVHEWIAPIDLRTRLRWVWVSYALLAAYVAGGAVFDAAFPYRDAVSRWSRNLDRELRHQLRPGDRIVIAPGADVNENTLWYLHRFRKQTLPAGVVPCSGDVSGRLWVLTLTKGCPAGESDAEFVFSLRTAGWVPVADTKYSLRPDRDLRVWHHCRLICLQRPGDAPDPPQINSSP
jgi:hypothetical protein